ncbi:MAG: hypothetical protein WC968_03905 [Bacilli bacterium]
MRKKQQFREIERQLKTKYRNIRENEIIVRDTHFDDGRITKVGYLSLKQQADYIPIYDVIMIKVPKDHENDFKSSLELVAAKELIRIKKDILSTSIIGLIFFVLGVSLLIIKEVTGLSSQKIINEILLIISWIFIWSSAEKVIFEIRRFRNDRLNIFHLLSATIKTY